MIASFAFYLLEQIHQKIKDGYCEEVGNKGNFKSFFKF